MYTIYFSNEIRYSSCSSINDRFMQMSKVESKCTKTATKRIEAGISPAVIGYSFIRSCILYPVSCILYPLCCILFPVSYILCPVSCVLYPVSCILHPVSYILYSISCVLYPVSCILYPVSYILYPVSYILYPVSYFLSCDCPLISIFQSFFSPKYSSPINSSIRRSSANTG